MRYTPVGLTVALALLCAACASPPDKEMNQARGAIQAAHAAGADLYAPAEYQAAVTALKRSEDAVSQRDYRQALNYALDSREAAENAARTAADQKAVARAQAESDLREVQALLGGVTARLKSLDALRGKRRPAMADERRTVADAEASVQKARTAMAGRNYLAARDDVRGLNDRLRAAIAAIDRQNPPAATRPRR
jgi:hypothetical protein